MLKRGSFANGMIAESPRIEGERVSAVGEGATEQANVATRRVFDNLRSSCAKSKTKGTNKWDTYCWLEPYAARCSPRP